MSDFDSVIFTPGDEPYLGLAELKALDDLIVAVMNEMKRAKPLTASESLSTHQRAATLLIPSGVSLCLSGRELIRQAYLHGASTLLRPIMERAVTIKYLRLNPNALVIWEKGWEYRRRPKLSEMVNNIFSDCIDDELSKALFEKNLSLHHVLTREGNDMIHGGLQALLQNVNYTDGGPMSSSAKVVNRPDLAKKASLECATWLTILMLESAAAFPES